MNHLRLFKFSTSIVLAICLLVFSSNGYANSEYINSLLSSAESNKSVDRAKFTKTLENLANEINNFDNEQSQQYRYYLAYEYGYHAKFAKSEREIKEILEQKPSHALRYKLESLLLNVYVASQQWEQGARQASRLINLPTDKISSEQYQLSLLTLILFHNQVGQPIQSFRYLDKIIPETLSDRNGCIYRQVDLEAKIEVKPLFVNPEVMLDAIDVCDSAEEYLFSGIIRVYLSEWLNEKERHHEAIEALVPFVERLNDINYPILKAAVYNQLALASFKNGQFDDAELYVSLAQKLSNTLIKTKQVADTYEILYLLENSKGEFKNALEYYKKFTNAQNAYIDEVKAKSIAFQIAQHDEFAKLKEIELLNSENKRMALETKLNKKRKEEYYFLVIVLFGIIIVGGSWSYRSWLLKEKLRKINEFDPLTGALSRSHFIEVANKVARRQKKKQNEVCCVVFDIDYLKQINDSNGHTAGDMVIQRVAEQCEKLDPVNKLFGRVAGEEFALFFPDCSTLLGLAFAEDYQKAINALDFSDMGIQTKLSASFGITSSALSGYDCKQLLGDGDSAMFSAKNHGRNKIYRYKQPYTANKTSTQGI